MRCLVLLLTLIPLLACALAGPAAAQPTELTITEVWVGLVYGLRPWGSP